MDGWMEGSFIDLQKKFTQKIVSLSTIIKFSIYSAKIQYIYYSFQGVCVCVNQGLRQCLDVKELTEL